MVEKTSDEPRRRGRPPSFDAGRTLDRIVELMRHEGLDTLSLNELARRAGASKPALAAAFGDKQALLAHAVERYYETFGARAEEALAAEPLQAALDAYFAAFREVFAPAPRMGCLLVEAGMECAVAGDPLGATVAALDARVQATLRARLAAARKAGEVAADVDLEALARFVGAQVAAMAIMARRGADPAALENFAEMAVAAVLALARRG